MNYSDDSRFFTFSYTDETSQFDPAGYWQGGTECYMRDFYCRIPREMEDDQDAIDKFIEDHSHEEAFWRDGPDSAKPPAGASPNSDPRPAPTP